MADRSTASQACFHTSDLGLGNDGAGWLVPELVIGSSCGMLGHDITDTIDNNERI